MYTKDRDSAGTDELSELDDDELSWVYTREFSRGEPRGSLVYLTSPCALLR